MLTATDRIDRAWCLTNVSKDMFEGDLGPVNVEPRRCESGCETLVVEQRIEAVLGGHQCDGNIGRLLDGKLIVDLVQAFTNGQPDQRAVHADKQRLHGGHPRLLRGDEPDQPAAASRPAAAVRPHRAVAGVDR